ETRMRRGGCRTRVSGNQGGLPMRALRAGPAADSTYYKDRSGSLSGSLMTSRVLGLAVLGASERRMSSGCDRLLNLFSTRFQASRVASLALSHSSSDLPLAFCHPVARSL